MEMWMWTCLAFELTAISSFSSSAQFVEIVRQLQHSDIRRFLCGLFTNITYLLTTCSRVLLEKLTGSTASQEIPHIFGTRRFLTVLTSARHLSLP